MKLYLFILALTILDIISLMCAKAWQIENKSIYLLLSFFALGFMSVFFGLSTRYETTGLVNGIWMAVSAISITLVGHWLFEEQISLNQWIGMAVILVGLAIIEWK